ncbi:MAG: energy-coupling factor transporter transmembrane component T [Verrucomicrobiota bacterium]
MSNQVHPIAAFIYVIGIFAAAMSMNNPLLLVSLVLFLWGVHVMLMPFKQWRAFAYFGFCSAIPFIFLNALVNSQGERALLEFLGREFTLEALLYGIMAAVKVWVTIMAFSLLGVITSYNDLIIKLTASFPKLGTLLQMSLAWLPKLLSDVKRIRLVLESRGVPFKTKCISQRMKAWVYLWKVAITSALESAWERGEALQARGFRMGSKTQYKTWPMNGISFVFILCGIAALVFSLLARYWNPVDWQFFPALVIADWKPSIMCSLLWCVLFCIPIILRAFNGRKYV